MNKEQEKALAEEQKKITADKEEFDKKMEILKKQKEAQISEQEKQEQALKNKLVVDVSKTQIDINMQKPVIARLKLRYKEVQKLSQAKNEKIMRGNQAHWFYTPPKIFVSRLRSTMSNGVGTVSYYVYKMDEKGNKKATPHYVDVPQNDGTTKKELLSISYDFEKFVVETIKFRKPMLVEEYRQ
jgi:hypothetical protein